ncbi:Angiopoietin-1 receptor [Holothuria leucospilota]|uniref:Angiopoietin-1 receptor n=1 Tax=Holothuria leucospilota TaxID=206669 RepID=A0A9Q1C7Q4_HOLLE|nr:Angiopoietin-1 receptor [Holothuria leucospilota]
MVMKLIVLLAILCECRGQIFHDIGTFILQDNSAILSTSSTSRKICYDGSDVYYTNGNQIFRVGSTTPIFTAPQDIDSLSCYQDALAYTYQTPASGSTAAMSHVVFCNINDFTICFAKWFTNKGPLVVFISTVINKVIVVSRTCFWCYDFDFDGTVIHVDSFDLNFAPACVAVYVDGPANNWFFFISHPGQTQVSLITYNTVSQNAVVTSFNVQNVNGISAIVSCLAVSGNNIYFLVDSAQTTQSEIDIYAVSGWTSPPYPSYPSATVVPGSQLANDIPDNVNGLIVCTSSTCPAPPATSCTTTQCMSPCGFCTNLSPTDCVCPNSNDQCCQYTVSTVANQCNVPITQADACCVINNPLAQRRRPGDINIFAAAGEAATFDFPRRTSPIGRFGINDLPAGTMTTGMDGAPTSVWWRRWRIPQPGSLRGRRFGVFLAEVDPNGVPASQDIPCIVTENSGFYNELYTYTRVAGATSSVTLVASANSHVNSFVQTMRWQFRRIDQSTSMQVGANPTPLGSCSGSLTCTIGNPLEKSDEGIYEVYRPGRVLRLWHPIFFLFVRECPQTQYMSGGACTGCANMCVYGDCVENQCICYPGFTGNTCNTATTMGFVGQNGDIPCSTFNFDTTPPFECRDLLFCYANKLGCRCSTGLRPPKCWFDCLPGFWGPNCMNTCSGATCNRRDGTT